jgi:predicted RNA methylase
LAAVIERLIKGFHKTCLKIFGSDVEILFEPVSVHPRTVVLDGDFFWPDINPNFILGSTESARFAVGYIDFI